MSSPRHRHPGAPRTDENRTETPQGNLAAEMEVIDVSPTSRTDTVRPSVAHGRSAAEVQELYRLADETARDSQIYLDAVTEVAAGSQPDSAIPVMLLALSQILLAGARLGAITDVVPSERFERDPGPDADVDPLRANLANLFEGVDEYVEVDDPLTRPDVVAGSLSGDIAFVAADLAHGLHHYGAGRVDEALWWWQYSYLSSWGQRASGALRVFQSMIGHLRLDVDADTAADAEFDALHPQS